MGIDKFGSFFDIAKKYLGKFYTFFKDNKNNSKIMLLIASTTSLLAIFFAVQLYRDLRLMNEKTSELANISNYDTHILANDLVTQVVLKNSETIKDLLQENKIVNAEISKYTEYLHGLQIPYTYLLKYIYLPSLNVWEENYTENIDVNLI